MRFIHFNDIFLGNSIESGHSWEHERAGEIEESLRGIMRKAEDEKVSLIMITGGLFAHIPVEKELEAVSDIFRAHPDIEVVITAGETDAVIGSSPVRSFTWPYNVHYVLTDGVERIVPGKTGAEIYASSVVRQGGRTGKGSSCAPAGTLASAADKYQYSEPIRIAMLRAEDDSEVIHAFSGAGFSYVACGGGSRNRTVIERLAYAPGHLEPWDPADTGAHGIMLGDISAETGRLESIEFIPMASAMYVTLNIRVNSSVTARELAESIASETEKRGRRNIYRLHLTGMRNPDEHMDIEEICRELRISSVTDDTEPEYDYERLFREHSQDLIGFYISSIAGNRKNMSRLEEKAMLYGIDALISTSGEEL